MNKLNTILEQTVPGLGYELVDVEFAPSKIIRVFIDKDGGVTIEDCELVSNHLSKLLLVEEIEFNRLEVSSPGIERPLKRLEDFVRFQGKLIKIKSREAHNGQKAFQGEIESVDGETITLRLEDGNIFTIDFPGINRARLVFEYKSPKKNLE